MSTLHQIASAKDGEPFIAVGPVTIHKQFDTKKAKNDKLFSSVILKTGPMEMFLTLWGDAAQWRLPLEELTLRGKFTKGTYNGKPCLNCEEISKPEGAVEVNPDDVRKPLEKPTMKECLNAGLRAADFMIKKERPELAEAAFTFACNALAQGIKPE